MANERFASIWDAIEETPEQAESMRVRAELMQQIRERVSSWGVIQQEAASRLNISQPRLNDLLKGKVNRFSLDALVNMTRPAGLHIHLTVDDGRQAAEAV